jgi:hypothetical protein
MVLLSVCAFALDTPSADEILRKAAENEKKGATASQQYTFRFHSEVHKANGDGTAGTLINSRDADVIFLEKHQFWKPVLFDGKPLDPKQLEQVKADMKKAAEHQRAQGDDAPMESGDYVHDSYDYSIGSVSDVLRLKKSTLLREEDVEGRKTWVIQSDPEKDRAHTSHRDEQLLCYRDLFWIDQQDLIVIKCELYVLREYVDPQPQRGVARPLKPGSFIRAIYTKVNDSDWLMLKSTFYARRKYPVGTISFGDSRLVFEQTYSNYKKFDVNTTVTFDPDQQ